MNVVEQRAVAWHIGCDPLIRASITAALDQRDVDRAAQQLEQFLREHLMPADDMAQAGTQQRNLQCGRSRSGLSLSLGLGEAVPFISALSALEHRCQGCSGPAFRVSAH